MITLLFCFIIAQHGAVRKSDQQFHSYGVNLLLNEVLLHNMKLLRNEVSFGHEVKFAQYAAAYFIREAYFMCACTFHLPSGQISWKKALA